MGDSSDNKKVAVDFSQFDKREKQKETVKPPKERQPTPPPQRRGPSKTDKKLQELNGEIEALKKQLKAADTTGAIEDFKQQWAAQLLTFQQVTNQQNKRVEELQVQVRDFTAKLEAEEKLRDERKVGLQKAFDLIRLLKSRYTLPLKKAGFKSTIEVAHKLENLLMELLG